MNRTEIDGVPVFWRQGPEPLSAGLCFGVGRRDETFATGGITHLVEHLVMGALPKSHLDRNASVSLKGTEFTATGRPEAIAAFLEQVCGLLADLPTERRATEARVLAAEQERAGADLLGHLLLLRYGAVGVGLAGMPEPAIATLTDADVRAHAARWFVRENAALWLTGPPPADLRLPLPTGTAPVRTPQRRLPLPLPAQERYPGPDPALSFETTADDASLCGLRILLDRMTDRLRHQGGHSYDIDFVPDVVDRGTAHVAFFADAPEKEVKDVVHGMVLELRRFVEEGPTADELADDLEGAREHFSDPRSTEADVAATVMRHLDGLPPQDVDERLLAAESFTPDEVRAALAPALDSLLVLVPDDAPAVAPEVPALPEGTADALTGRTWKRKLRSDAPRRSRLVTSPDGVSMVVGDSQLTVRYDDCVAVGQAPGADHAHLELVGGHGMVLTVCEQDWRGGGALLAEVADKVRELPRYPLDAEKPDA